MHRVKKKICLAGKNEIAVYGLSSLLKYVDKTDIYVVCNSTDHGFDTWQPSLLKAAIDNEINIKTVDQCYDIDELIFLSLEFDQIISPEKFSNAKLYNIHFSNLPAYKGMYTSALPLLNDEKESGVTLHCIDSGIDTGNIINQLKFSIEKSDTARSLYAKYLIYSKKLLSENILNILNNDVISYPQEAFGSTYFSKKAINYRNLEINYMSTAEQIFNQIRAFTFPEYQVPRLLGYYVNSAKILNVRSQSRPGTLLEVNDIEFIMATVDYDLKLSRDINYELFEAAAENDEAKALVCISRGADFDHRNGKGWTPLIVASFNGSVDVLKFLLRVGADPNKTNYKGTTPLMYAMTHFENTGKRLAFDTLMDFGASMDLRDYRGFSVLDYAKERNVYGLF